MANQLRKSSQNVSYSTKIAHCYCIVLQCSEWYLERRGMGVIYCNKLSVSVCTVVVRASASTRGRESRGRLFLSWVSGLDSS